MVQSETKRASLELGRNFLASVVVFLVAVPLCLGIAMACGVPPALGLISGIIGGIVIGSLSGAPLQVSGPAAGLTVLVFDLVQKYGLEMLGVTVILSGLIQVMLGVLKLGRWFRVVSPAVIRGMLSGIGVLIVTGQLLVMVDMAPKSSGLDNLMAVPGAVHKLFDISANQHLVAFLVAAGTLAILIVWKKYDLDKRLHVPAALPAIGLAVAAAMVFQLPIKYVDIPRNFSSALNIPTLESLGHLANPEILLEAAMLALISSAVSLLSAAAVDRMHEGERTNNDKELLAQGVGNVVAGCFGALPLSGVIARSTVNVEARATNRLSAVLQGVWMLLIILLVPFVLSAIPTASLAALLVFTGFKLIDLDTVKKLRAAGWRELAIYLATVAMVVAEGLFHGVFFGIALSLVNLLYSMSRLKVSVETSDSQHTLVLAGAATLLGLPKLSDALARIPKGACVVIDRSGLTFIDHACSECLRDFEKRHTAGGGRLVESVAAVSTKKQSVSA